MLNKNEKGILYFGIRNDYSAFGKYYMRSADEDREISPRQLRSLRLSISDSIVNIETNNQELTFEQLKMLYAGGCEFITVTIPLDRKNMSEMRRGETEKQTLNERDEKILNSKKSGQWVVYWLR